jgi:hypothetical protein
MRAKDSFISGMSTSHSTIAEKRDSKAKRRGSEDFAPNDFDLEGFSLDSVEPIQGVDNGQDIDSKRSTDVIEEVKASELMTPPRNSVVRKSISDDLLTGLRQNTSPGTSPGKNDDVHHVTVYIQTELCSQTLAQYLVRRNAILDALRRRIGETEQYMTEKARYMTEAKRIAEQIVEGLQFIHTECQVPYYELKPNNIYLTQDLQVKLGGDLGLVKRLESFHKVAISPMMISSAGERSPVGTNTDEITFSVDNNDNVANDFVMKVENLPGSPILAPFGDTPSINSRVTEGRPASTSVDLSRNSLKLSDSLQLYTSPERRDSRSPLIEGNVPIISTAS